jgi:pimeloyl-ACP methyl ester carboxylesterase
MKRLVLVILALALLAVIPSAMSASGASTTPKPTVVLVHGAFADASSWSSVISRLQKDGYPVIAPATG